MQGRKEGYGGKGCEGRRQKCSQGERIKFKATTWIPAGEEASERDAAGG